MLPSKLSLFCGEFVRCRERLLLVDLSDSDGGTIGSDGGTTGSEGGVTGSDGGVTGSDGGTGLCAFRNC